MKDRLNGQIGHVNVYLSAGMLTCAWPIVPISYLSRHCKGVATYIIKGLNLICQSYNVVMSNWSKETRNTITCLFADWFHEVFPWLPGQIQWTKLAKRYYNTINMKIWFCVTTFDPHRADSCFQILAHCWNQELVWSSCTYNTFIRC